MTTAARRMTEADRLRLMTDRNREMWVANKQHLAIEWYTKNNQHEAAEERRRALVATYERIAAIDAALGERT